MKYFVSDDWEKLLEKESKMVKKSSKIVEKNITIQNLEFRIQNSCQTLVVFPDLRTIMNSVDKKELTEKEVAFLSSTNSQ
jgi:hypothetical protein